jgi:hypothetical protein
VLFVVVDIIVFCYFSKVLTFSTNSLVRTMLLSAKLSLPSILPIRNFSDSRGSDLLGTSACSDSGISSLDASTSSLQSMPSQGSESNSPRLRPGWGTVPDFFFIFSLLQQLFLVTILILSLRIREKSEKGFHDTKNPQAVMPERLNFTPNEFFYYYQKKIFDFYDKHPLKLAAGFLFVRVYLIFM